MSQITVALIDHMGSDLSVVNAARVSFAKQSVLENDGKLAEKDARLIRYLASHNHWTPFGHTALTFHIKAPLFVARQLGKHQVGLVWNEVSRRYVDDEPEFYNPVWRERPEGSVKQGSAGPLKHPEIADDHYYYAIYEANRAYERLLDRGVAPEQARMVLPQSMMTEWYWTGNLAAFARVYGLRADPHTQLETQEVAKMLSEEIFPKFPVSWAALTSRLL